MKIKRSIILTLTLATSLFIANHSSAITYQNTTDIDYTINPTISISLSSSDLVIDNLTPGNSSDSNVVTINVATNSRAGYYLTATAGTAGGNTNLANTASSGQTFTSLASNAASLANIPDNKWGYSYSTNGGTTWVSGDTGSAVTGYNGLPLDNGDNGATGIKLVDANSYANSGSVQFKIGAKAASTQASGTYNGTVNFYAVTSPNAPTLADVTYMQDVTSDMVANTAEEMTFALKDKRDEQSYTVAKLKDGRLWMAKDLNIAGGTTLTCDMTDCDGGYVLPSDQGWTAAGKLPGSSTTGFEVDNYAYVYNSGNTTGCGGSGQNTPCYSYYSWDAATLGSGRNITTQNTDAPYSICPKGWRLPTSGQSDGTTAFTNWKRGDFYRLLTAYGANLEDAYGHYTATFWTDAGAGTVANFLLSGYYFRSTFDDGGSYGRYWSSTSTSSTNSRGSLVNTGYVSSANNDYRRAGFSVRCLYSGYPTLADVTYMQDVTSDIVANTAEEMTFTLKDKRDEQSYTVAKLKDGRLWMTKNLNIAGGTTLTCDMTDCDGGYVLPSNQGWQSVGQLPASAIKNDNDNNLTDSSQFSQDDYAYVYNSGNTTGCGGSGQNTPCFSYYSWDAATLGSGRSIATENTDAPYSICPKGWRLPTSGQHDGTTPEINWKRGDFYRLLTAYGADLEDTYHQNTESFWSNAGVGTVANFLLSGYYDSYDGSTFYNGGTRGGYWSSTSTSSTDSRYLRFGTDLVNSGDNYARWGGLSVRCMLR